MDPKDVKKDQMGSVGSSNTPEGLNKHYTGAGTNKPGKVKSQPRDGRGAGK